MPDALAQTLASNYTCIPSIPISSHLDPNHLGNNLNLATSSEDDSSSQASDLLIILGVDIGQNGVLALFHVISISLPQYE